MAAAPRNSIPRDLRICDVPLDIHVIRWPAIYQHRDAHLTLNARSEIWTDRTLS